MDNDVTLKPIGMEGMRSRMEAIRSRMRGAGMIADDFQVPEAPSGLSGTIGAPGTNAPMNPFGPGNTVGGPKGAADLHGMIQRAASAANIDPALLDSLVATESAYDPSARSRAGAMGLTQLMPGTAKQMDVDDPFDPEQNLFGGAKYLASLMTRYKDPKLAIAAYNAGPGSVDKHGGIPPYPETQNYVQRVLAGYEQRKAR